MKDEVAVIVIGSLLASVKYELRAILSVFPWITVWAGIVVTNAGGLFVMAIVKLLATDSGCGSETVKEIR